MPPQKNGHIRIPVIETHTISMTVPLRLEECGNISIAATATDNITENTADLHRYVLPHLPTIYANG